MNTGSSIPSFRDESLGIAFNGAYVFECADRSLLINENGYIILLDNALLSQLKQHCLNEELTMLLIQHRFASMDEVELPIMQTDKRVHPVFFMIDLTNRCNMACRYCLRDGEDSLDANVTSAETIEKICQYIINYCRSYDETKITIQPWGGEPLLEKERIFQIQDILQNSGIDPCITIETNGILLSESMIQELRQRNIWVSVSIDGPAAVHDTQRVFHNGSPTHSVVERNLIRLYEAYEGNISVIATVTRETYSRIDDIICYLVKELHLQNIKINFVHKSSFVDNTDLCMTSEEIGFSALQILKTLINLTKEDYTVSDYNIYTKLMNLLFNQRNDVCICDGCHGGRRMITFDYHGNVFPCDVTDYPEECLGNISTEPDLVSMVEKAIPQKSYFKEKKQPQCGSCPWYCYCRGGCTVHVKTQGDEPPAVDEIECAVNRTLYPELVRLIISEPQTVNRLLKAEVL